MTGEFVSPLSDEARWNLLIRAAEAGEVEAQRDAGAYLPPVSGLAGVPICQLPFAATRKLPLQATPMHGSTSRRCFWPAKAAKLKAAGVNVTWFPFDGEHNIPAAVIRELNAFLAEQSF